MSETWTQPYIRDDYLDTQRAATQADVDDFQKRARKLTRLVSALQFALDEASPPAKAEEWHPRRDPVKAMG